MPKQSGLLKQLQVRHEIELRARVAFTRQFMLDMACITLNVQYSFAEKRIGDFVDAMTKVMEEASDIILDDCKDDKDLIYSREKIDMALQRALGSRFKPWDERYKL